MHAGRYQQLVQFYDARYTPGERNRLVSVAARRVTSPTLEGLVQEARFGLAQRWLPRALIELGHFARARQEIERSMREATALQAVEISVGKQVSKSTADTLRSLRTSRQYLDWFEHGDRRGMEMFLSDLDVLRGVSPDKQLPVLTERAFIYDKVFGDSRKAIELLDRVIAMAGELSALHIDAKYAYSLQAYKRKAWLLMRAGRLAEAKLTLDAYAAMADSPLIRAGKSVAENVEYFRGYLVMLECTAGAVYAMSRDFASAEKHFNVAKASLQRIPAGSDHMWDRNALAAYHIMFGTYFQAGQGAVREGLASIRKGLPFLQPAYIDALSTEIDIETAHAQVAQLHLQLGEFEPALQHAQDAHAFARRYRSSPSAANASSVMGAVFLQQGRVREALEQYRRAEQETAGAESAENWHLYHGLGQAHRLAGASGPALRAALMAVDEVEKLWAGRFDDIPRQLLFLGDRLVVYESAIEMLVDQQRWEEAFAIVEKAKARTAYELSEREGAKAEAATGLLSPMTYSQVRQALPEDTVLLEYFVGTRIVIGMAVSPGRGILGGRLAVRSADLRAQVEGYRDAIGRGAGPRTLSPMARELYVRLVKPFQPSLAAARYVGVIPHGVLHALPFGTVQFDRDPAEYLIERHAMFFAPSATLLVRSKALEQNVRTNALVLASPPEISAKAAGLDEPLLKLDSADAGGRLVAGLFGRATLFTDAEATESNARRYAAEHANIVIAAHAMVRHDDTQRSGIFLAADLSNDGLLTVREIERLSTKASLVVLSGCTTAVVTTYSGGGKTDVAEYPLADDLVSINRAFLRAGASSVVSSLWIVDDDATEQLMQPFLRHYVAGVPRAKALQMAMLALLAPSNPKRQYHPMYWGAWVLTGDWR